MLCKLKSPTYDLLVRVSIAHSFQRDSAECSPILLCETRTQDGYLILEERPGTYLTSTLVEWRSCGFLQRIACILPDFEVCPTYQARGVLLWRIATCL